MKLHLPGKLRAALLACYAISASLVTTISSGSFVGGAMVTTAAAVLASQQTYGATIVYDGGTITGFGYGSVIADPAVGDVSFSRGDNITFLGDTTLALGGNVTAGIFGVAKDVVLDISSNGYKIDAAFDIKDSVLRLHSDALGDKAVLYRSNAGRVEIAWGSASASLAEQLVNFTGLLDVNDTTYQLGEKETYYSKLVLHGSEGNGTLSTMTATYTMPLVSIGDTSINVGDNSTIVTGMISGFGSISKSGPGILTIKANNVYHYGDLIIDEGIVRWADEADVDGDGNPITPSNKLSFANIVINKDATFVDSHMGQSLVNTTSVTLNNGTIKSFAMGQFDSDEWDDLTVNTYKALYVLGSGTIDAERSGGHRFAKLTSLNGEGWVEGSAPTSTTLNIGNGTSFTSTIIDRIENFHGSITSLDAMTPDHRFRVDEAHQDAGYAVTLDMAANVFGFTKTGEGAVTFTNKLTAEDTVTVKGGNLNIKGELVAEAVDVSSGSMVVEQNATLQTLFVSGDAHFSTGARTQKFTVADEVRVSGGEFTVSSEITSLIASQDVVIEGGTTTINGSLEAENLYVKGDANTSLTVNGSVTVESLEKLGAAVLTLPKYGEDKSHKVTITRCLTMNYGGAADSFNGGQFDVLAPENGLVLKYNDDAPHVIKLGYGIEAEQSRLGYMFVDVFNVDAAKLAQGINLGIASDVHSGQVGPRVDHLYASTLGQKGKDYVIVTGDDGYYYLKTTKGQSATTSWDINWGTEVVSAAPEVVKPWVYTSIDDTGLYGSAYDDKGFFIASELAGSNATGAPGTGTSDPVTGEVVTSAVNVFGGAYDSVDPEGARIERDIWLKVSDGNFALVAGGSMCGGTTAVAGWSLVGDTHIYVDAEVDTIGSVVAGNYLNAYEPNWQGDGYISVNTSGLTGSVFGGGYNSVSHEGDSTVYVYTALKSNIPTPILDYTIGDTETGMGLVMNQNTIAGGLFAARSTQWLGDGLVVIDLQNDKTSNRMAKSIVGGNFANGMGDNDVVTRIGNNHVVVRNTCAGDDSRLFSNYIVGGDLLVNLGSCEMVGDTLVEFSNMGTLTYIGAKSYNINNVFVTGGHMVLNTVPNSKYTSVSNFTITGNTHIRIKDAENGVFNANIVAGHATSRDKLWDNSEDIAANNMFERLNVSTINGDTYIEADSGLFRGVLVGGHYYEDFIHDALPDNPGQVPAHPRQGTEPDTLIISGTSHINLTGGNYRNMVLGGSYYDGWDTLTMYTGGVEINVSNAVMGDQNLKGTSNAYNYAVVGGYYIDEYIHGEEKDAPYSSSNPHSVGLSATIGDINLTIADTTVNGVILGGSHILRSQASGGGVRQGNITVNLESGTYNGNIYAAGSQLSSVELYTESSTVRISDEVKFGSNVTVCGGYMGSGASAVHGDTTLEFYSKSKYDNLANTNFIFFDVVKVTEAEGYVVLPHNTTLLGDYITKRGAGTLELGVQNKLDMLTVAEGRLKLAANSGGTAAGTKIEQLNLCKGATLDLTAGNCGINGDLVVEGGSTIMFGTGLAPTAIERLIWDDSEKVMLTLSSIPNSAESYVVELFTGLTKADIVGLDMRTLDIGNDNWEYGVRASQYINSNVDLTNSYLLLQGDKLVLSRAPRRSIYWEYQNGGSGYWTSENAWAKKDETASDAVFNNEPGSDNVVFSNNYDTGINESTITVNQEVMPYDIYVQNGKYIFTGEGKEAVIRPFGSVVLSGGAVAWFTEDVTLQTDSATTVIALQDEASSLEVNNDISINKLYSKGNVDVNGNLAMAEGTSEGGLLQVSGDMTVGGDSTFAELKVNGDVKNNADYKLTVGGKESYVGAIDGGVVGVLKGAEFNINPYGAPETTKLTALEGLGSLETKNRLELAADSKIGDLNADSLLLKGSLQSTGSVSVTTDIAVSNSVTVTGALEAASITYNNLILKSSYAMIDVEGNVYSSVPSDQLMMNVDTSMIATQILSDGKPYYLLKSDEGGMSDVSVVFDASGATELHAHNDRYDYTAYTVSDGVVLKADLTNPNLFEDKVSETPNGITGGKLLDELYTDATILEQFPNGDLALTMEAINQQLMINNSKEGLDDLFAAVAGASIPAMGVAFADDINRQLQAIRNRTTTMGVDQCAVNEDMPYFNAWINAEGGNRNLDEDGTSSGYDLSSWGGTVGFDVDFTPRLTAGIAVSAMYGDYSANAPDDAEGDFDTQYVTAFARYGYRSWVHTFIASVGRADATLERTVHHQYGSYRTKGETDGLGFGLMYEVGYVRALNETGTACIQPVMNFALTKASLDGYTEEDSDAGLKVDDIEMTTFTVGAGARIQAVVGENLYNRSSVFECRALAKFRAGDRNAETDVGFAAAAMGTGPVESAEIGAVGIELGAGIVIPLGAEYSSVFADVNAEFSSGYTAVNGTIGYRINF